MDERYAPATEEKGLSKIRFFEELYNDYATAEDDPTNLYSYIVKNFIEQPQLTADGNHLSFNLIVEKYAKYKEWWFAEHGDKGKYLSKDEKLVSITQFLIKRMYDRTFVIRIKSRDEYLFGSHDELKLINKLKSFLHAIGR